MRKRIVLWGSNDKDEKLLLALELNEKENSVDLHTFTEAIATQELYNKLMSEWRENKDFEFPEEKESFSRPLSITDSILPDNIKTDRTDLINQAKAEWHFTVLSSKLYEYYSSELATIKEKVATLASYDSKIWDEIKSFWDKVQEQMNEENLFKGQGYKLKKSTNEVFDKLKSLRKVMDEEFNKASAIVKKEFMSSLETIESKIDKGLGLQPIFNELKKLQGDFKNADFSRSDRNKVWKRLDKAFKVLKEKRYGNKPNSGNSEFDRLKNRYDGLLNAIKRMEQSLNRDKKDKSFQDRRINDTDGQLELQLRQAKIVMIDQRISSKQERLDDMIKTKVELEGKIKRAEIKVQKETERKELEAKKSKIKEKIEADLKETKDSLDVDQEKLTKAAADIKASRTKSPAKKKTTPPVDLTKEEDGKTEDTKAEDGKAEDGKTEDSKTEEGKNEDDNTEKSEDKGAVAEVEAAIKEVAEKVEVVVETIAEKLSTIADFVEDKVEDFIDEMKGDSEEE